MGGAHGQYYRDIWADNIRQFGDIADAVGSHLHDQVPSVQGSGEDRQRNPNFAARASLVEVLPTDPVIAMTVVSECSRIFSTMYRAK